MPQSLFPQWLHDIGLIAGLLGFLITVVVMWEVRAIKRSFRSKARLPEVTRDLEKIGSALNGTLENWPSKRHLARGHLKVAASLINATLPLLTNPERKLAKSMRHKLTIAARQFEDQRFDNAAEVWDLYSDIQSTIASLNQVARNMKWE